MSLGTAGCLCWLCLNTSQSLLWQMLHRFTRLFLPVSLPGSRGRSGWAPLIRLTCCSPSDTALVEQPVSGARSPHCGSSSRRAGTPAPPPESLLVGGRARRPFSPAPLVRAARVPRSAGEVAGV